MKAREKLLQEQRQEGIDLQRDFEGSTKELTSSESPPAVSPEGSSVNDVLPVPQLSPIVRYAIR